MPEIIKGKGAVSGIAIGKVMLLGMDFEKEMRKYAQAAPEEEEKRYRAAYEAAVKDIEGTIERAGETGTKEQLSIMEAHLSIIFDPVLEANILEKIHQSLPAPIAVFKASEEAAGLISCIDDPYIRERAADIKDVGKKIVNMLLEIKQPDFNQGDIIICGDEIEPSIIAGIPEGKVKGIIIGQGSITSHAVIIAKARGIATIVGLGDRVKKIQDGTKIILNGSLGDIILNPDNVLIGEYVKKLVEEKALDDYYLSLSKIPSVTRDGVKITLSANIGNPDDIDTAVRYGCEGVGLFRTEFIFMGRQCLPTEEEQFEAYRYVVEKCSGKLCIIRTMDIGGDKPLPYLNTDKEENPFLGWRAIRICLERTEIFIMQIKAILRAGAYGKVAIMLPMIINLEEIIKAKELVSQAMTELKNEGKEYSSEVQIGIMVETPAAAVMAPILAKECDFFSIGTNDLVQYTLAVDRGNSKVSKLYNHFNPAVLKLIDMTIKAAHLNGIWAGMCGEMAGDPAASGLLVSMGIDELSMSAPSIPKVKEVIIDTTADKEIVRKVLSLNDAGKVIEFLNMKKISAI